VKATSRPQPHPDRIIIEPDDIETSVNRGGDPFASLDSMYNIGNIRAQLVQLQQTFQLAAGMVFHDFLVILSSLLNDYQNMLGMYLLQLRVAMNLKRVTLCFGALQALGKRPSLALLVKYCSNSTSYRRILLLKRQAWT
jgi:uncharacterized protein YukE